MTRTGYADIYARISDDAEGEALGVERQVTDCLALAEREGFTVRNVWRENDTGASTRTRKPRPFYRAMVEGVRQGQVSAVVAYSNSRLTRRPRELEEWIELHAATGVRIVTVVSGEDNLATADGRMVARIKASVDAAEAERTGERVQRKHLESAKAGKPVGGTRPFGYQSDKVTIEASEAALIRDAIEKLLAGMPVHALVREWNAAGVTTSRSGPWTTQAFKQVIRNPRIAGLRSTFDKEQQKVVPFTLPDGTEVQGQWAPIVSRDVWEAVCLIVGKGAKPAKAGAPATRFLTGLAVCARCGQVMRCQTPPRAASGEYVGGVDNYYLQCPPKSQNPRACGSNGRSGKRVETLVVGHIVEVLRRSAAEPVEAEPWPGEGKLSGVIERLGEIQGAYREGALPLNVFLGLQADLLEDQARLQAERREWLGAHAAPSVVGGDATADGFPSMPLERRRAIASALIQSVVIEPLPTVDGRKVKAWNPDLVRVLWR